MAGKESEAERQRKARRAHRVHVASLEGENASLKVRVIQQDTDIVLLTAMLGKAEEGVWNPSEYERVIEGLRVQEQWTLKLREGLSRLEEKAEKAAVLIGQLRIDKAQLKVELATEQARNTQLEADMARTEGMLDSMMTEEKYGDVR